MGHAVRNLAEAVQYYEQILGFQVECRETLEKEAVDVVFLALANSSVELIAPRDGNITLNRFLEKRGEGLHHVCYKVPSVTGELERLRALGVKLIDESPRVGSRGLFVAFIHPSSCRGAMIELCSDSV